MGDPELLAWPNAFANPVVTLKFYGHPIFIGDAALVDAVLEEAWLSYGQYGLPVYADPGALPEDPLERRCQIGGLIALALDKTDCETGLPFRIEWPQSGYDLEADIMLDDDGEWALQPVLIRQPDRVH